MTTATSYDINALIAVKYSIDGTLIELGNKLDLFFASPENNLALLDSACGESRRLVRIVKLIGLDDVAVFCHEIELALQRLKEFPRLNTKKERDALESALFVVRRHLDALVNGGSRSALCLFPQYRDLQQLRGIELSHEHDLFYPNLDVRLPEQVMDLPPGANARAELKAFRSRYQQELLRWLRKQEVGTTLLQMRQVLDGVMKSVRQDEDRAFWWVSCGFLDCIRQSGLPPEFNAGKLLGRLDHELRSVSEGKNPDVRLILNEMLYMIARCNVVSDRVKDIKRIYALNDLLPDHTPMPASERELLASKIRDQIRVAQETWESAVKGSMAAIGQFVQQTSLLMSPIGKLEAPSLQFLAQQMQVLSAQASTSEQAQNSALYMAMALLLLDSGVEHYRVLNNDDFQEQARLISGLLQASLKRLPEDAVQIDDLVERNILTEHNELIVALANEMLVDLEHVTRSMTSYFGKLNPQEELSNTFRLLNQLQGGLQVAALDDAGRLIRALQTRLRLIAQTGVDAEEDDKNSWNAALKSLESYLQDLKRGNSGRLSVLQQVIDELTANQGTSQECAPFVSPATTNLEIDNQNHEQELIEIFLDEARQVLKSIRDHQQSCQAHPGNLDALTTIRRGFHTLKGSGRMVGLSEFSEVAWVVERAMNKWLEANKQATTGLLRFINAAQQTFAGWVGTLSEHGTPSFEATGLLSAARQIENGIELEKTAAHKLLTERPTVAEGVAGNQESPSEIIVPANPVKIYGQNSVPERQPVSSNLNVSFNKEQMVQVGEKSLPKRLFSMACSEVKLNVSILHTHYLEMEPETATQMKTDFLRSTHALINLYQTLGVDSAMRLAAALEVWVKERLASPCFLNEAQLKMLEQTIASLEAAMLSTLLHRTPIIRNDLVSQLQSDTLSPVDQDGATDQVANIAPEQPEHLASLDTHLTNQFQPETLDAPAFQLSPESLVNDQPVEPAVKIVKPELQDEIDQQLLPVYLEEAEELSGKIADGLRTWHNSPKLDSQLFPLKRQLHTFKGSSRMVGAMRIGELIHEMEDQVCADSELRASASFWDSLNKNFLRIGELLEELRGGNSPSATSGENADTLFSKTQSASGIGATDHSVRERIGDRRLPYQTERGAFVNLLRVNPDMLDLLVIDAGELSVSHARMEAEMHSFREHLAELASSVTRLRKQLREVDIQAETQMQFSASLSNESDLNFDPLELDRFSRLQELTRFINESVHDVQTVQHVMLKNLEHTGAVLNEQGRLGRELQQNLMKIRMVSFNSIADRLYRIVRQTAKELNKRANLELQGGNVELDRSTLEKMIAPFEHLLRNAIVHGLESNPQRVSAGKNPIGEICLSLRQENNEVVFEFSDDGAGLNYPKLKEKALAKGWIQHSDTTSNAQLAQLIFMSGMTTADEVTEIAGRGVGMDVVRSEIAALGGVVDVKSVSGHGTIFIIRLPLTLAVTQIVLVRSGKSTYALPANQVEQVKQLKSAEINASHKLKRIDWQSNSYPLHYLPQLLSGSVVEQENHLRNPVLLLRNGEDRIALHVDEILGNQEVVVKNIGPQLSRLSGIAGATIMGNGMVVLILNPAQLAQRTDSVVLDTVPISQPLPSLPLVMVVDDSLTVRKIMERMLTRSGYQVVTATDGVDALEKLEDYSPNVILLDVEMPRMDGFALLGELRDKPATRTLPVIMITSRTADKHREYALQLGVNAYMGKPYHEDELLQKISELVMAQQQEA